MSAIKCVIFFVVILRISACPHLRRLKEESLQIVHDESMPHQEHRIFTPTDSSKDKPHINMMAPYCIKTKGKAPPSTKKNVCSANIGISKSFEKIVKKYSKNPLDLSHIFGASLRIAFHDAAEVDINTTDLYGPDGCLSTNSDDNAGMIEASSPIFTVLEPLWQEHCHEISRADFWVLFAQKVVQYADPTKTIDMNYQYGRKDNVGGCNGGSGRLPNPQLCGDIHKTFIVQMGLTQDDSVALMGGHTLGHVHPAISGYGFPENTSDFLNNAWDSTPNTFDNEYYVSMIVPQWDNVQINGPKINIWQNERMIMLDTDFVLGFPTDCTTTNTVNGIEYPVGLLDQQCPISTDEVGGMVYGCTDISNDINASLDDRLNGGITTPPSTYPLVYEFSIDNAAFLKHFAISYTKMTSVGYGLTSTTASGKLGTLTPISFSTCESK